MKNGYCHPETERLLQWYDAERRILPWREDPTPYHVWISEIMLQQTRVDTVIPYYERFLEELPDVRSLAEAPEERILKLWQGLGYYSRVRNMQKAARQIQAEHGGIVPRDPGQLGKLAGIGEYTAAAIASIAYQVRVPSVDGNLLRVFARTTGYEQSIRTPEAKRAAQAYFLERLPEDRPGDMNQALMDLGATICLPNGLPDCGRCPWQDCCMAHQTGREQELPLREEKKARMIDRRTILVIRAGDRYAIRRRPPRGLLAGLYEFPGEEGHLAEAEALAACRQLGFVPEGISRIPDAKHVFTHREWLMTGYRIDAEPCEAPEGLLLVTAEELSEKYSFPTALAAFLPQGRAAAERVEAIKPEPFGDMRYPAGIGAARVFPEDSKKGGTEMEKYVQELKELAAAAVRDRRYLHANAELSFEETGTAAFLREELGKCGVTFEEGYSGNSTVCTLTGGQDGPTIAFRADIDALPIQEDNDLPYRSQNDGVMHACGHDAHAAVLLAMVRFFAAHRELIRGKIKFIFQQAEEKLPGGAGILCREGVLEDVEEIYAWHAAAIQPIGEVSLVEGHSHAAVGEYRLVIRGKGGHGGFPHQANNPILCAASITGILNQMVTTRVDPLKAGVITTAYIHSGTDHVPNVIPAECIVGGNIRTLDNDLIEKMYAWTEQICRTQCEAFGCEYEFEINRGYPSTELGGHPMEVMKAVTEEMGLANTNPIPQMGAEDFSYYSLRKPAAFIMIGMQDPRDAEDPTPHHNPRFRIDDENGLPVALEFVIRCYLKAVS